MEAEVTVIDKYGTEFKVQPSEGDRLVDLLEKAKKKGAIIGRGSNVRVNTGEYPNVNQLWKTTWTTLDRS